MSRRPLISVLLLWLCSLGPVMAAGGELTLYSPKLHKFLPINNSMIAVWIAVGLIVLFCRAATKQMKLIPSGIQNFAEWLFESLYGFLEGLLGAHLTKRTFWFLGTLINRPRHTRVADRFISQKY